MRRAGYRLAFAGDGLTGLRMIRELSPALVVLDLMLPELDGRAVARIAREECDPSIIMVTALGSTAERVSGLESGADDYLAKPFASSELVARVRAVLRRRRPSAPERILSHAGLEVDPARRVARLAGRPLDLTAVQFDLLHALVRAEGRVLSRELLIDAVRRSGAAEDIRDRSIDVYVRRLRSKLEDDFRSPAYILTVRGVGYRLAGGEPEVSGRDLATWSVRLRTVPPPPRSPTTIPSRAAGEPPGCRAADRRGAQPKTSSRLRCRSDTSVASACPG